MRLIVIFFIISSFQFRRFVFVVVCCHCQMVQLYTFFVAFSQFEKFDHRDAELDLSKATKRKHVSVRFRPYMNFFSKRHCRIKVGFINLAIFILTNFTDMFAYIATFTLNKNSVFTLNSVINKMVLALRNFIRKN